LADGRDEHDAGLDQPRVTEDAEEHSRRVQEEMTMLEA